MKNDQNNQSGQNVNNDQNQWKVNVIAVLCVCLVWLYLSEHRIFLLVFFYRAYMYCVLRFCIGKATSRGENTSVNKDKELFAIIVNLSPQKGIFTSLLSWNK